MNEWEQIIDDVINNECDDHTRVIEIISKLLIKTHYECDDTQRLQEIKKNIGLILYVHRQEYYLIVIPKNLIKNVFRYQSWDYLFKTLTSNGFERTEETKNEILKECFDLGVKNKDVKIFKIGEYAHEHYIPWNLYATYGEIQDVETVWLCHESDVDIFHDPYFGLDLID